MAHIQCPKLSAWQESTRSLEVLKLTSGHYLAFSPWLIFLHDVCTKYAKIPTRVLQANTYGKTSAARHPPKPTVYAFLGRKGTVMQVCDSAAMVEAREGQSIREVRVTADCFYRDGRAVLTNPNRVLHKEEVVNIDYMVGRMGCKDNVHCNLAWQGRKPQGVPCLSPDEFKEKISARGSGSAFIDDLQRHACGIFCSFLSRCFDFIYYFVRL